MGDIVLAGHLRLVVEATVEANAFEGAFRTQFGGPPPPDLDALPQVQCDGDLIVRRVGEGIYVLCGSTWYDLLTLDPASYSRISTFEQCPKKYAGNYLRPHPKGLLNPCGLPRVASRRSADPEILTESAADFGSLLHSTLEKVVAQHLYEEREDHLDRQMLDRVYGETWEQSTLSDLAVYKEGKRLLHLYAARLGVLSHWDVLGTEVDFDIALGTRGGYRIRGSIDRADRLPRDGAIRIVDYKTNRLLYSSSDLQNSLQLAIYTMAAQSLWGEWATDVEARYEMLRHNVAQEVTFSDEDLADATEYLVRTMRRLEQRDTFPARLNAYCPYCGYNETCEAYQGFLEVERTDQVDLNDLTAVAEAYEAIAYTAKVAYAKKRELETPILAAIAQEGPIVLDGTEYAFSTDTATYYSIGDAARIIAEVAGLPTQVVMARLGVAGPGVIADVVRSLGLRPYQESQIAEALEAVVQYDRSQRLTSKLIGWR